MRVMEKSKTVVLKLEDRGSNDLFAACPIDTYPGHALGNLTYIYIYQLKHNNLLITFYS